MYVLWRNKPHAVLGLNDKWIPKGEIPHKLDQVRFFEDAGEARFVQRTKYSKSGVSVLNQKSFKEKAKVHKLPVFKTGAETVSQTEKIDSDTVSLDKPCIYGEYLERLCDGDGGQRSRVVFPPSNLAYTTQTPILQSASSILTDLLAHISELENREQQLREEIRQLDLLNSDRLHQVEMYDLTDEECVTFVHALHESQLERRKRKNELAAILAEKEVFQKLDRNELKQAVKMIQGLGRQEYHCRVLSENDPIVKTHRKN